MKIIKNWLDGKRNYHVGLAIFKTVSKDQQLISLFQKGETIYNKKRLEEELQKLMGKPAVTITPIKEQHDTDVMPDSEDAVLQALKNEWMPIYQEMNYMRHELDKYEGNEIAAIAKRKDLAFDILDKEQQCMLIWKRADIYKQTGKLPEEKDAVWEVPTDPQLLAAAINNCKKNIRRNKLDLRKNPANADAAKRYRDYKAWHIKLTGKEYIEKN